jgi:hypothetical protein
MELTVGGVSRAGSGDVSYPSKVRGWRRSVRSGDSLELGEDLPYRTLESVESTERWVSKDLCRQATDACPHRSPGQARGPCVWQPG